VASGYWPLADAYIRVMVHKNDPNFFTRDIFRFKSGGSGKVTNYRIVVPASEAALVRSEAKIAIGHFPENADRLIQQNRKFLIWHNLSDEVLTPYMSINYYKQLAARHGGYAKLQRNVRLFGLPSTGRCSMTGVGPGNFDALTAIENWVEKGQAPDALPAQLLDPKYSNPGFGKFDFTKPPLRTMPLCKYWRREQCSQLVMFRHRPADASGWRERPSGRRTRVIASAPPAGEVRRGGLSRTPYSARRQSPCFSSTRVASPFGPIGESYSTTEQTGLLCEANSLVSSSLIDGSRSGSLITRCEFSKSSRLFHQISMMQSKPGSITSPVTGFRSGVR
jgi:hypothetical protein